MKSILYAGGVLMLAAGIYGFVDYKKTNAKAAFQNMLEETEVVQPGVSIGDDPVITKEDLTSQTSAKSSAPVKEKRAKAGTGSKQADENKREKKSREISPELFSRAPLKEVPKVKVGENVEKTGKSKTSD